MMASPEEKDLSFLASFGSGAAADFAAGAKVPARGTARISPDGFNGACLSFPPGGCVQYDSRSNLIPSQGSLVFHFRLGPDEQSGRMPLVLFSTGAAGKITIMLREGRPAAEIGTTPDTVKVLSGPGDSLADGVWHQMAITWKNDTGIGGEWKGGVGRGGFVLAVDGEIRLTEWAVGVPDSFGDSFSFGSAANQADWRLDEVRIYRRALSGGEIRELYEAGI